jgi:hypothetical protein
MRNRTSRGRLALAVGFLGLASLGVFWGRTTATPPGTKTERPPAPDSAEVSPDYSKRVVAYIHNNIPITREDLGEYLIARFGADRLQMLVNKRIIEHECRQKGITCTAAEVEAGLEEDLRGINVNRKEFVERVLKHYNKTLYEWKEDVIRPRILMTKVCRDRVQVTEDDVRKAFEAYYGEKIDCRIILFPAGEERKVLHEIYAKIRESEAEFDRYASQQASPTLAASGGKIKPIGRHTTGNEEMERAAFALQPGQLSRVIHTPEGLLVLKCVARIPPDTTKTLDDVRADLEKEVFDKKVSLEIPNAFKEMSERASAKLFLKSYTTEEDWLRDIREEFSSARPGER